MTWQQVLKQADYPTTAIVLDFETYFDKDYNLKKMSTIEYVKDERFEVIGLGYQIDNMPIDFVESRFINQKLKDFDFDSFTAVCQNCKFDCLILQEHYGITPKYTIDIKDLDRIWDARAKHSLEAMAKRWKAPKPKGDTQQFKGYRWADMSAEMRDSLQEYCKNDIEIESFLFQKLLPLVPNPQIELPLATQTLQLYLKPQLLIDKEFGAKLKEEMLIEMLKPLEALQEKGLDCSHEDISGNISFLELLNQYLPNNEQVPIKSGKNGMIPALAREDEGMKYLLEHPKEEIRLLAKARQAVKSWPLHIKRVDKLMNQARASNGKIGAPLSFYAAHTGRWGGTEGINLQNLGKRGRTGSGIHSLIKSVRKMLKAPNGYIFGMADFAQIEARILAWFAGQNNLVQGFANGEDVYSEFATELFGCRIRKPKENDPQPVKKMLQIKRGFGKDGILGCGYGMGANKFYLRCRANDDLRPTFESGEYDWDFVNKLIKTYRSKYNKIPEFWDQVEKAWRFVTKYPNEKVRVLKPYFAVQPASMLEFYNQDGATFIVLPSGRYLRYPYANVNNQGDLLYRWGKLWGGSITENIVQATARDIFGEALLRLKDRWFNIVTHTHDDIISLLKHEGELQEMIDTMSVVSSWATGLPIAVEGKLSERFGE